MGRAGSRRGRGARGVLSERVAASAVDRLFREHFGQAVAALIRAVCDWDVAEEAAQDAFATAAARWPRDGLAGIVARAITRYAARARTLIPDWGAP